MLDEQNDQKKLLNDFNEFKDKYQVILEDKIYSPYFISKQTILQYQDNDDDIHQEYVSFMDIIETLFKN